MNKVILIGNVGGQPEIRKVSEESVVANFSLATSKSYKDRSGQRVEKTEWHRIVVWNQAARIVEKWVNKGDKLAIEGELQTRSYESNGEKKYITEVKCSNLQMLGSKPKQEPTSQPAQEEAGFPTGEDQLIPGMDEPGYAGPPY